MSTIETSNTPIQELQKLINTLPEDATWEDIEYAMNVVQKIRKGQESAKSGQCLSSNEVRKQFQEWRK
ncbi:hypothetical protein OAH05_02840 [bacterium]|jgi:hypothetical protein|nr:hypothetical protein [Planctomicrobium sp.]MDB4802846.1 hypothetical protein [bacterium]